MPLRQVVDAVEGRLAEGWSACPVISVNSSEGLPRDGSSCLVVQYPVALGRRASFGSPGQNIYREEGTVRLVINQTRGAGLDQALTWADQLAALFRGQVIGGVRFYAPTSPAIDDRNDAGNFFQLAVTVPYEADFTG